MKKAQIFPFFFELIKANSIISRRLVGHGLDFKDYMILHFLHNSPEGRLKRIELSEKMGITASGITRMLLPLEKLHILKHDQSVADARARYVRLTPAGEELLHDATTTIKMKIEELLPPKIASKLGDLAAVLKELNESARE